MIVLEMLTCYSKDKDREVLCPCESPQLAGTPDSYTSK